MGDTVEWSEEKKFNCLIMKLTCPVPSWQIFEF